MTNLKTILTNILPKKKEAGDEELADSEYNRRLGYNQAIYKIEDKLPALIQELEAWGIKQRADELQKALGVLLNHKVDNNIGDVIIVLDERLQSLTKEANHG